MNEPLAITQLGVSGVVVVILIVIVRTLWQDVQQLRKESREDQAEILPALTQATAALAQAALAIDRVTRLYDQTPRGG